MPGSGTLRFGHVKIRMAAIRPDKAPVGPKKSKVLAQDLQAA